MIRNIHILLFALLLLVSCKTSKHAFSKDDMVKSQKLFGLNFSGSSIDTMFPYLQRNSAGYDSMRTYSLSNETLPAILFNPIPPKFEFPEADNCNYIPESIISSDVTDADIPFLTVAELGALVKNGKISSEELTRLYIDRIKEYDSTLKTVITLIEEDALAKARAADAEIALGNYRGPLHGIPYGVKDLAAVEGYPTTWGAMPYKDQVIDYTATVVEKLNAAGAILIAKLTSGALARGDVWWGGRTVNPWDTLQGASGSSAGSGSATAAGLVGFSIGTETLGSITSPSNRNGVTGLRPTYGRVSRYGFMPLSWSMDKVGPICRSAEGCLLVFQAIQGKDVNDPTTYNVPFCYEGNQSTNDLRIGILQKLFDQDTTQASKIVNEALEKIHGLELEMTEDSLPANFPFNAFDIILRAEAGAFFDELVRSGKVDMMVQQGQRSRANSLRQSRFIPAVEYIQANRHRQVLIEEMDGFMSKYDVVVSPTFGGRQLMITNLTGHPVITIPTGLDEDGHPTSITLIGRLFEEEKIIRLAHYIQQHTPYDEMHPPLFIEK